MLAVWQQRLRHDKAEVLIKSNNCTLNIPGMTCVCVRVCVFHVRAVQPFEKNKYRDHAVTSPSQVNRVSSLCDNDKLQSEANGGP